MKNSMYLQYMQFDQVNNNKEAGTDQAVSILRCLRECSVLIVVAGSRVA